MKRIAIMSDMHFGDSRSSLSTVLGQNKLTQLLKDYSPFEEIVLLGDILDLNISTLYCSIEGTPRSMSKSGTKLEGFRSFMQRLLIDKKVHVKRLVYVPGNHDYFIFQQKAIYSNFIKRIENGKKLTGKPLLFYRSENSYLRGLLPEEYRGKFILSYPNYVIRLEKGTNILCTHGHYLDRFENMLKSIEDIIGNVEKVSNIKQKRKIRRNLMKRSALFQMLLKDVASSKKARELFDRLSLGLNYTSRLVSILRGKRIHDKMIEYIEQYIHYFHDGPQPGAFVFGHTHFQDKIWNNNRLNLFKKPILICNTGSFIRTKSKDFAGTFIIVDFKPSRPIYESIMILRTE